MIAAGVEKGLGDLARLFRCGKLVPSHDSFELVLQRERQNRVHTSKRKLSNATPATFPCASSSGARAHVGFEAELQPLSACVRIHNVCARAVLGVLAVAVVQLVHILVMQAVLAVLVNARRLPRITPC